VFWVEQVPRCMTHARHKEQSLAHVTLSDSGAGYVASSQFLFFLVALSLMLAYAPRVMENV
jgi:hypothetical protein